MVFYFFPGIILENGKSKRGTLSSVESSFKYSSEIRNLQSGCCYCPWIMKDRACTLFYLLYSLICLSPKWKHTRSPIIFKLFFMNRFKWLFKNWTDSWKGENIRFYSCSNYCISLYCLRRQCSLYRPSRRFSGGQLPSYGARSMDHLYFWIPPLFSWETLWWQNKGQQILSDP